jgi:hypothetical protein
MRVMADRDQLPGKPVPTMFKNSSGALLGATPEVALPMLLAAALLAASSACAQAGR